VPSDSDIKEELVQLRSEFEETSEVIKQEANQYPERTQISRAERAQIAVGLGIVTAYITLIISETISGPSVNQCVDLTGKFSSLCVLSNQFVLALIFLILKSISMTLRPIFSQRSQDLHISFLRLELNLEHAFRILNKVLQASYISILLFSVASAFWIIIRPNSVIQYGFVIYNTLQLAVVAIPGLWYAGQINEAMESIRTSSPEQSLTVSRGPRGTSESLYLYNETGTEIEEESISFIISAPDNVDVILEQAFEDPSRTNRWIYPNSISSDRNHPKEVDVTITTNGPPEPNERMSDDSPGVIVFTYQDGELVDEDRFSIR